MSLVFSYNPFVCMQMSVLNTSFFLLFSLVSFISLAKYCEKWNDFSKLLKKKNVLRNISVKSPYRCFWKDS